MFSKYLKSILIVLVATSFMSNSYAAWNYNKNKTKCVGNRCKHVIFHKHCAHGKCWHTKHVKFYNR